MSDKIYLGDGAYAELKVGCIVVTTSDGMSDTNTIYLEPDALTTLFQFAVAKGWKAPEVAP